MSRSCENCGAYETNGYDDACPGMDGFCKFCRPTAKPEKALELIEQWTSLEHSYDCDNDYRDAECERCDVETQMEELVQ